MANKQGTVAVKTEPDENKKDDQGVSIALQNGRVTMTNQRRPLYQGPKMTPGNRRASTTRRGGY